MRQHQPIANAANDLHGAKANRAARGAVFSYTRFDCNYGARSCGSVGCSRVDCLFGGQVRRGLVDTLARSCFLADHLHSICCSDEDRWERAEAEKPVAEVLDGAKAVRLQRVSDSEGVLEIKYVATSAKDWTSPGQRRPGLRARKCGQSTCKVSAVIAVGSELGPVRSSARTGRGKLLRHRRGGERAPLL